MKPCPISTKIGKKEETGMSELKKIRDVRSQIGQPDRLKPIIIGCPTLQRRGKPCQMKKVGGKGENGMSDLDMSRSEKD